MRIRNIALPAALVAGLGFAFAERAQASPITSAGAGVTSASLRFGHGGRSHGGHGGHRHGGSGFSMGHRHGGLGLSLGTRYGGHLHSGGYASSGYWSTQSVPTTVAVSVPYTVTVQVPSHITGTDVRGQPVWAFRTETRTEYRTEYRTQWVTQQVWVRTR